MLLEIIHANDGGEVTPSKEISSMNGWISIPHHCLGKMRNESPRLRPLVFEAVSSDDKSETVEGDARSQISLSENIQRSTTSFDLHTGSCTSHTDKQVYYKSIGSNK